MLRRDRSAGPVCKLQAQSSSRGPACRHLGGIMDEQKRLIRARLKAAEKELRSAKRALAEQTSLTPTLRTRGMMIWAGANGSVELATEYILAKKDSLKNNGTLVRELLTQEWASKDEGEKIRLRDGPHSLSETRNYHAVTRWLKEKKIHDWVETQNVTKGIAPMQRIVVSQINNPTECTEPSAVHTPAPVSRGRKQWMRRWRRRWNVTLARLQAGDVLPPEVAQRKAVCETVSNTRPMQPLICEP